MTGILARLAARATGRGETGGPPTLAPPVRPLFAPPEPGSADPQNERMSWQTGEAEFADTGPERPIGAPIAAPPGPADRSGAPEALSIADIGSHFEAPTGHATERALASGRRPPPPMETPSPALGPANRTGRHRIIGPEEPRASIEAGDAEPGAPDRTDLNRQAKARPRSAVLGASPADSGAQASSEDVQKPQAEETPHGHRAPTPELSPQPAPRLHPIAAVNPPTPEQSHAPPQKRYPLAPFADEPVGTDALERPALSIGRLDVIFEAPSVPPPPRRKGAERTRGFDAFERVRLGLRR